MDQWLRELREQLLEANKETEAAKKNAVVQIEQAKGVFVLWFRVTL